MKLRIVNILSAQVAIFFFSPLEYLENAKYSKSWQHSDQFLSFCTPVTKTECQLLSGFGVQPVQLWLILDGAGAALNNQEYVTQQSLMIKKKKL